MNITNNTDFPHFQFEKVGYFGELFSVIVVSQTFDLSSDGGICPISEIQRPPVLADTWFGEPEMSSLKTATDLVCKKKRSEIILSGHAWNAAGRASDWQGEFQVGDFRRTISVCGSCEWRYSQGQWELSQPRQTDHVPLHFELASYSEFNPVGRHLPEYGDTQCVFPAPQLSSSPGAVCRSWPSRIRYANGFNSEWQRHTRPFYPDEFDFTFLSCAPPEQQYVGFLKGDEKVVLNGLLPTKAKFTSFLPGIRLLAELYKGVQVPEQRLLLADTLTCYTDDEQLTLIWRLTLPSNGLPDSLILQAHREAAHG
ncbi:DUF2169 family type VI secretion system accessory protein [Rahnella sikkimica]|uniref:DUF2169 domain-containing protein n=1 Tax=Rahnella sikkimica TaxID=1805933 RepID=A0A2L1UVU8_9GAMM|nr:DUF2169 domain-containing protein [Rahnella sikkimica]AVF36968.1 hypothetical protein BV494_19495 [Rahnella sikkimica]